MRQQLPRNGCHCPFSTTVVIYHPKNPQRHASSGTTEEVKIHTRSTNSCTEKNQMSETCKNSEPQPPNLTLNNSIPN